MANEVLKIYSFLALICLSCGISVNIPEAVYEVARGDDAVIPCTFKSEKPFVSGANINWKARIDSENELDIGTYYYGDSSVDITTDYTGKATIDIDVSKGITNLKLKAVKIEDNMVYVCEVRIPKDNTGKSTDTAKLIVLIAPSIPKCQVQGKAEYYQNINLTCSSAEGSPSPTYSWANYDVNNKPRPNPPKTTDVNGVLSLYNISMDTSGFYICTSANKIRSVTCNLTLAVMPPSMSIASTAGIIGACVAAALILGIIICCCCYRRKKEKDEEYTMGRVDYTDQEPHEIEEQQGEKVKSKNPDSSEHSEDRRDNYDDRQGRSNGQRNDRYDDRRSDRYDDQRSDRYDDRRSDRYDDRRSDRYDDQRSDRYDDRRDDRYDDRRSDRYDDQRSDRYDDRRGDRYDDQRNDRYDDRRDRYDDRRNDNRDRYDDRRDRYNDRNDDRDRPPSVPPTKPTRG